MNRHISPQVIENNVKRSRGYYHCSQNTDIHNPYRDCKEVHIADAHSSVAQQQSLGAGLRIPRGERWRERGEAERRGDKSSPRYIGSEIPFASRLDLGEEKEKREKR